MKKLALILALASCAPAPAMAGPRLTIPYLSSLCQSKGGTVTDTGSRRQGATWIPYVVCSF